MASIMTSIELQDKFSTVVYGMIRSANLTIAAMYDMREAVSGDMDTSGLEGAKEQLDQATLAADQLKRAMEEAAQTVPANPFPDAPLQVPINPPISLPQQMPTEVPVKWQTENMPVFTGTGIERFEQEVENANQMLNQLYNTQQAIAAQSENMDVFSPEAQQDLEQLATRIEAVNAQINKIENNPVNIGTDAANAGMEHLRSQINQALRTQQSLNKAVDNMDVEGANAAYLQLSGTIADTERYIRDNVDAQGQFNQTIEQGVSSANNLSQTIKRMAATYISIQGLQKVIGLSDELASTNAKLDMMNDGVRTTKELQDMIYVSAQRSRGSYLDMASSVAKLGNLAKDAFGSTEEVVAFSEQLNKQFILAGASTSEIKNATLQLTQALSSGVLRGDELNSIFEQAPTIIQSIADYMDVPIGQIRELASEGQITADIVKNAMFAAADETNAKFESMPKTFEQIGQSIKNSAIMAFEPILTRLNEIANSEGFNDMVDSIIQALVILANIAMDVFNLLAAGAGFVADSWVILGPIIYGVAAALAVYYGWQVMTNAINKISKVLHTAQAAAMMLHAAVTGTLTKATAEQIAAQMGLNAALNACPIMWIVMLIVVLITVIGGAIAAMDKFGDGSTTVIEKICGAFAVAGAFIGNLIISLINSIISAFTILWNFIALFANFFANVFTDPVGAVARLFFGLIDLILAGVQTLASVIDTLFGTSLAEAVEGWRVDLDNWVTEKFGEGKVVMEKKNAEDYYLHGLDYEDAWNKGVEFGGRFGGDLPDAAQYGDFDYSSYLTDISDDLGDVKDELCVSEEDLKYLRDIAEQEAVNRFTTAEITIEQTNHNTVSGGMDLDGVIAGLTDAAAEAAEIITEGVY